jgi:hypothetical protein
MQHVLDTPATRAALDHFTSEYVGVNSDVIGVRTLADESGTYLAVVIRQGAQVDLPATYEGLSLQISEAVPGWVAAGPVR